jgi:hypothetical protein
MVFVHVDGDVVSGMAACQPVVLVCALCCGRVDTDCLLCASVVFLVCSNSVRCADGLVLRAKGEADWNWNMACGAQECGRK